MKPIASITEARTEINSCTVNYRYSSALRLGMFLDALDSEDISGFRIYKVSCKFAHDVTHFDIVIVTCNGVICSTCNEYLEYGFYDRHTLALFIHGFIDLHPTHQCSEFWLKPRSDKLPQPSLTVSWALQTTQDKQTYEFHEVYSRFDTAYCLTESTFDKVKNPFETVTLETAMKFVSVQNVKEEMMQDTCKQCLIDLKSLKLHKSPQLVEELLLLTSRAKELLKKSGKRTITVTDETGEQVEVVQPPLYQSVRQETKRTRYGETSRSTIQAQSPSIISTVYNAIESLISPS